MDRLELGGKINRARRLTACALTGGGAQDDSRRQISVTWVNSWRSTERVTRSERVSETRQVCGSGGTGLGAAVLYQARAQAIEGQGVRRGGEAGDPTPELQDAPSCLAQPPPSPPPSPPLPSPEGRIAAYLAADPKPNRAFSRRGPPRPPAAPGPPRKPRQEAPRREAPRALTRDSTTGAARITPAQGKAGVALQQVTPRVGFSARRRLRAGNAKFSRRVVVQFRVVRLLVQTQRFEPCPCPFINTIYPPSFSLTPTLRLFGRKLTYLASSPRPAPRRGGEDSAASALEERFLCSPSSAVPCVTGSLRKRNGAHHLLLNHSALKCTFSNQKVG